MEQDRSKIKAAMLLMLLVGALVTWYAANTAQHVINQTYAQLSVQLRAAHMPPLTLIDTVRPHRLPNGREWPSKPSANTVQLAQIELDRAKVAGIVPLTWAAGVGAFCLLFGGLCALNVYSPNPRRNLINLERDKITIKSADDSLPIIQTRSMLPFMVKKWGIMRRLDMKGAGRRQFGNGIFFGAPGSGKSNMLIYWLLMCNALNFIVIDLKGDLYKKTAGHRAKLGPVYCLNLRETTGHSLDPFDRKKADVNSIFEIILPTDDARSAHFNRAAQEIAAAFWEAARATGKTAVRVLVSAAISDAAGMVQQAQELLNAAPEKDRAALLHGFKGAFGSVWDDPSTAAGGERGSVVNSFKAAFSGLNTPEILSTMSSTTIDIAEIIKGRATLYITTETTDFPNKIPLQILIGVIIDEVFAYCDKNGAGEEIVFIADEAGELKVPRFSRILATGRSRNVSMTAFLQDFGQLDQYHTRGWRGLTDTIHHWTLWKGKNPDARAFMREMCGVYDKPNTTRDADEKKRRPYIEANPFDEIAPSFDQGKVIGILDYDRNYIVYGDFVNPYEGEAQRRMATKAPQLPELPHSDAVTPGAPPAPPAAPQTTPAAPPTPTTPPADPPALKLNETF